MKQNVKTQENRYVSLRRLLYLFTYLVILIFLNIALVKSLGQFFEIVNDKVPLSANEPFLTSDAFECGRNRQCMSVVQPSNGEEDMLASEFSIKKINGRCIVLKIVFF